MFKPQSKYSKEELILCSEGDLFGPDDESCPQEKC